MAWRAITNQDILTKLSADELAQVRAQASEGTDPVSDAVALVVERVRGSIAANSKNTMGPEGTLPERLIDAAVALMVPALYGRTAGLLIDLNDVRKEAAKEATALLREVARGLFAVELPATGPVAEEDARSAAAELVSGGGPTLRRDDLAGL
jgi:hypothetical protein